MRSERSTPSLRVRVVLAPTCATVLALAGAAYASVPSVVSFSLHDIWWYATSPNITLNNTCSGDPTHYMASESSGFAGATWQTYSTAPSFTLSEGYGDKTVYFKVRNGEAESAAAEATISYWRTITFAGRDWAVQKTESTHVSDSEENVYIDEQGRLHLKVTQHGSAWMGAVLRSAGPTRPGVHRFYVETALGSLDKNLDACPYLFYPDSQGQSVNEIDLEYYWEPYTASEPTDPRMHFIVDGGPKPYPHLSTFAMDPAWDAMTYYIDWHGPTDPVTDAPYVHFKSFLTSQANDVYDPEPSLFGPAGPTSPAGTLIAESRYDETDRNPSADTPLRITICNVFKKDMPQPHGDGGGLDFVIAAADLPAPNTTLNVYFTQQERPESQVALVGESPTISVAAATSTPGGPTLAHHWQKDGVALSNGAHYSGVLTNQLTIISATSADAGDYRCRVTEDGIPSDSVISNAANLDVRHVRIDTQPEAPDYPLSVGEAAQLSVGTSAVSGSSRTWQWKKNGLSLTNGGNYAGVASDTLTVTMAPCVAGPYTCEVTATGSFDTESVTSAVVDLEGRLQMPDFASGNDPADNDVDLDDFTHFRGCFNGPNRVYANTDPPGVCDDADLDLDGDVDLDDFTVFRSCFNGPNRPPTDICKAGQAGGGVNGLLGGMNTLEESGSGDVTFDLQSPQAGQTISAGTYVEWHAGVAVTGENQGLGGWDYSLFLGPDSGPAPGPDGRWGTPDDENLSNITLDVAAWSEVYAVAGANGKPTVGADMTAAGNCGGPGMNVARSAGYNDRAGALLQVGSAHLDWNPWRYVSTGKNPGWYGDHTWGVGLDDRKDDLLLNTSGAYELNVGSIDTTNLAPGHYVLMLVPASGIDLLRPDADLSVSQPGRILAPAGSVNGPVSIEFDIGP